MPLNEPEEIDVLGKWWVPGRDQPHHPGVLRCNNEEDHVSTYSTISAFSQNP